ncbi:hypothetical protein ACFL1R_07045 [Candidatus Latescibacterota bacterium]
MEEKSTVTLNRKQILELNEIIVDKDKEAAFKFLKENIYQPINKPKGSHCKPPF